MGCNPPDKEVDGFAVATPGLLNNSLARKLVPAVDRLRNLLTTLGARPYRVRIVRTRWTGGRRGVGVETVLGVTELVPTPKIIDMTTLAEVVTAVGTTEIGIVQLQEVSGRYTEDMLVGVDPSGNPAPDSDDVYYECEFFRTDGRDSDKRRFALSSVPYYAATRFQWLVTLDAAIEKRRRDGRPRP